MNNQTDLVVGYLNEKAGLINNYITQLIPSVEVPKLLKEAMEYSLLAGGKRIRPIFTLATYEAFGKDSTDILPIACCVELLHTYSLIHDDLPSMDNDDYRRGKLTNHKVFGEAIAILAGDALLTHSFGNIAKFLRSNQDLSKDDSLKIIEEFSQYSGATGMVGGQVVDFLGDKEKTSYTDLIYTHTHKTGDLITFSVRLGGILAGANQMQLEKLTQYGRNVGLAFQIQDDILDIIGDETKLGKKVGSDQLNEKVTYPSFKGIDVSKEDVNKLIILAKEAISDIDINSNNLDKIAEFIINREI
ncbi:MAG: polyprenyl synthetase family protein [Vulcanibacillus sp.]